MRAIVYPPPASGYPFLVALFHSDGSIALAKPFQDAESAQRYVVDITSCLVTAEPSGGNGPPPQCLT